MRTILAVVAALILAGCASVPTASKYSGGIKDSHLFLVVDGDASQFADAIDKLSSKEERDVVSNACKGDGVQQQALTVSTFVGAMVMAGVDWYFNYRQEKLDAWKKAATATYSKRILLTNEQLANSKCLLAIRMDTLKQAAHGTEVTGLVAVFTIYRNAGWFTITPTYVRAKRSVAATSDKDGTIDLSFALSVKGIVPGKAGEVAALKELGSGTTTTTKVTLGDIVADLRYATPTDMIPEPPASISHLSVTVAATETGHPSDVDQLSAENKALQSAAGAVLKAAAPSGK